MNILSKPNDFKQYFPYDSNFLKPGIKISLLVLLKNLHYCRECKYEID